ncbi:MAG: hypothetical protein JST96_01860 [Bacteroidetes bacterium]|nr:hypothetical protein [Bacteroidota bacterium]
MAANNFERMIHLVDEIFAVKNDPGQLDVDENVIKKLKEIHPATLSEYNEGSGPIAWVLLIPTTETLMNKFLFNTISEKELFEQTPVHVQYDALYLCSATTLEEYRGKGITKKITLDAIEKIRKEYPIKTLFVWPFTKQGDILAEKLAQEISLPLKKKQGTNM